VEGPILRRDSTLESINWSQQGKPHAIFQSVVAIMAQVSPPAPPAEWPTDASHYELIGKIGQGAFASVWGARTKMNNAGGDSSSRECAVKVLNLDHIDSNLSEIRLEVQAMRLSSHPNVLACHTAFVKGTDLWLVTQIMRKGSSLHSLQTARRSYRDRGLPCRMEDHILYVFHETLLGLKYIHDNGQIHRDIKYVHLVLNRMVCVSWKSGFSALNRLGFC